jgi:hypothetical protein
MREFFVILIVVFILFGIFRRMMFGSFYAAFDRMQKEQERREQEERKRKASGKTYIDQTGTSKIKGEIEDVEYEEIKEPKS